MTSTTDLPLKGTLDEFLGNTDSGAGMETVRATAASVATQISALLNLTSTAVRVVDKDLATPPGVPLVGDRYIVAATATGAWTGKEKNIALWDGAAWQFTAPVDGMVVLVVDEFELYGYRSSASAWQTITSAPLAFSTYALLAAVTGAPANVEATVYSDTQATTISRARTTNVATVVLSGLFSPVLAVGQTVNIAGLGGTGYNGSVVLTGVSTGGGNTTITYANTGGNEGTTADTAGRLDRNGAYASNGAGGWNWVGNPALNPTITAALALKADLASPVFTGNPTAPTPAASDNDTSIATTAFVTDKIGAPASAAARDFIARALADGASMNSTARPFLDALAAAKGSAYANTLMSLHATGPLKFSGSNITKMYSFDPTGRDTSQVAPIYNGSGGGNTQPVLTSDGVFLDSETGFNLATAGIPPLNSASFAMFMAIKFPAVVTYASVAAMNADLANQPNGTIAKVASGVWTNNTPDVTDARDAAIQTGYLVDGYYIKQNTPTPTWVVGTATTTSDVLVELLKVTYSGGSWSMYLDKHGRIQHLFSQTSPLKLKRMRAFGQDTIAAGSVTLAIFREAPYIRYFVNGEEVFAVNDSLLSFTDSSSATSVYLNGVRSGNANYPVRGIKFTLKSLDFTTGLTFSQFKAAHDVISGAAGTPRFSEKPKVMWGFIHSGQSWTVGTTGAATSWTTPSGWNGEISSITANPSVTQFDSHLTRQKPRGVYSTRFSGSNDFFNDSENLGPYATDIAANGTVNGNFSYGATPEDSTTSAMIWMSSNFPTVDFAAIKRGRGGTAMSVIMSESSPAWIRSALKKAPAGTSGASNTVTDYEHILKIVENMRDFAILERGYAKFEVPIFFWQHGQNGLISSYAADFITNYDRLNADIKAVTGQSKDLICLIDQIVGNSTNNTSVGTTINDDEKLEIIETRGTRPIFLVGPMYPVTSFLHPYRMGHRWIGEMVGKVANKVLGGDMWEPVRPKTYTLGANYVDIQFYVPVAPLQFATNANNIDSIVQTGGINTYGFGYSGGGLTITTVAVQAADTIRVTLSGTPVAGHTISYIKNTSRFGNLCDSDATVAKFKDQDWTVPFTSGEPYLKEGLVNDLKNWCVAFSKTF